MFKIDDNYFINPNSVEQLWQSNERYYIGLQSGEIIETSQLIYDTLIKIVGKDQLVAL